MSDWRILTEELWSGEKNICFFVHEGKCFWVVDEKFNFSLDAEKEYRAYLDKGNISLDQYTAACSLFRDGVLNLNSDNFLKYLMAEGRLVFSREVLEDILTFGIDRIENLHEDVEEYFLCGKELSKERLDSVYLMSSRLPTFYVNFDRKIFMHMDYGRGHEDLAYADWLAKCGDFCYLIPDRERYWESIRMGFWKYRLL